MTILLQWLIEYAWIFYIVCAIGAVVYVIRALTAHRERRLSLFTLERETATAQLVRAWAMVFVFIAIGALIFASTVFILPELPAQGPGTSRPTNTPAAGLELLTPTAGPTPSPTIGLLIPTATPTTATDAAGAPAATSPPSEPTEIPTPAPTDTPVPAASGAVNVRFGDFAELVDYSLPAAETTAAQPLLLTLRWRALQNTSTANYLVFTHLLSEDGSLIAQHDGAPAGGTRPTSEWGPGEVIADSHPMAFYDAGYVGPARIAVGMYDPATGRVLTQTGDDSVILPTVITIVP